MTDWNKIRNDFPVTENGAYFLSAGMTAPPKPVFEALTANYERLYREGDIHWRADLGRYGDLCRRLARLINAGPDDAAFVPNTSTAMSFIALSFKERAHGPFNIVSLQDEFPASTVAFEYLGIPMRYVQPLAGRYAVESVLELIDSATLAVVASYVQYCTGFRLDLSSLGRELSARGVLLVVNATQALPYYPVDVRAMSVDALSASLHKWGMTGHVGSLFVTSPAFRERFPSPLAGWLSVAGEGDEGIHISKNTPLRLLDSAHRYELGTFNLNAVLALDKALDYIEAIGTDSIRTRLKELTDELIAGLRALGVDIVTPLENEEERSAIVSFTLGDRNKACFNRLIEARVYPALRAGYIRVSVNIFNNSEDIRRLLEVVKTFE